MYKLSPNMVYIILWGMFVAAFICYDDQKGSNRFCRKLILLFIFQKDISQIVFHTTKVKNGLKL